MRISYKIALVGGIPVAVAAAIAVVAWIALNEAERAREGAVLAGGVYRDILVSTTVRDDYVTAHSADREGVAAQFDKLIAEARAGLDRLTPIASNPDNLAAVRSAAAALDQYVQRMGELMRITVVNDRQVADMGGRAGALIRLTDEARRRQNASNLDIAASLKAADAAARAARDVVDAAQELRAAITAHQLDEAALGRPTNRPAEDAEAERRAAFAAVRVGHAANDLVNLLRTGTGADAVRELLTLVGGLRAGDAPAGRLDPLGVRRLAEWTERVVKVNATEQRALYEELAQLQAYSVAASETEQATQNIAIATLKLGQDTAGALARRDVQGATRMIDQSRGLAAQVAALPISPLIQTEMIGALDQWRQALERTASGLSEQSQMIEDMDAAARTMNDDARGLNDVFTMDADAIGDFVRRILALGAAAGLLLAAGGGFVVARSITQPLKRLQHGMVELAADPSAGPLPDFRRRDELGEMTRAANFFVREINRRERALREAKERADTALTELRETQANLIQAEKLASLGQLVAGVAHEINTPLGIALTTATVLGDESRRFAIAATQGPLTRSVFSQFVDRMTEGARLVHANLNRAAGLVQSFKQVAADRASGERRRFNVELWASDVLTSLGPVLRKTRHRVVIDAPRDLSLDTYPGALAQVVTNLIMNAVTHAYDEGAAGTMRIEARESGPETVRIVFSDDGRGIPAENLGRVFDPFFTTGRGSGSTGLGLHIVFNLVTNVLQGRLDIDSAPGKGTRFIIDLPAVIVETTDAEPAAMPG